MYLPTDVVRERILLELRRGESERSRSGIFHPLERVDSHAIGLNVVLHPSTVYSAEPVVDAALVHANGRESSTGFQRVLAKVHATRVRATSRLASSVFRTHAERHEFIVRATRAGRR